MPLFIGNRERALFENLNDEIIQDIVGQYVDYYQVDSSHTEQDELYGEAISKVYKHPIRIYCLVDYQEPTATSTLEGVDTKYSIQVQFSRAKLAAQNIYPREGDFVLFGEVYYEIKNVLEVKIVGGMAYDNWKWDILCNAAPTRIDQLNLVEVNVKG